MTTTAVEDELRRVVRERDEVTQNFWALVEVNQYLRSLACVQALARERDDLLAACEAQRLLDTEGGKR